MPFDSHACAVGLTRSCMNRAVFVVRIARFFVESLQAIDYAVVLARTPLYNVTVCKSLANQHIYKAVHEFPFFS